MATFKDKLNREWVIDITKGDVRRVQVTLGVPFGELLADMPRLAKELLHDTDKFFSVVWCLISPQADAANVTRESFEDGWNGETEEAAGLAFVDAVLSFTPARKIKEQMATAFRAMETKQTELAKAMIQEATEVALAAMDRRAAATPTEPAANSPQSPESTATA